MDFTLQRSLILYGILCAILGVVCLCMHLFTPVLYLGAVGAVMGFMGGAVAWDTERRSRPMLPIRQVDESIKNELDKSK